MQTAYQRKPARHADVLRKPRYLVTRESWYSQASMPNNEYANREMDLAEILDTIGPDWSLGREWESAEWMNRKAATTADLEGYDMFISRFKRDEFGTYRDGLTIRKMDGSKVPAREFLRLAVMTEIVWL